MLHVIASWRLHELPQQSSLQEPHLTATSVDDAKSDFDSTDYHLIYDLFRLEKILAEMTQNSVLDILDLGSNRLLSSPTNLHALVKKTVTRACKYLNCCIWCQKVVDTQRVTGINTTDFNLFRLFMCTVYGNMYSVWQEQHCFMALCFQESKWIRLQLSV